MCVLCMSTDVCAVKTCWVKMIICNSLKHRYLSAVTEFFSTDLKHSLIVAGYFCSSNLIVAKFRFVIVKSTI